jgi:hypothetical protein
MTSRLQCPQCLGPSRWEDNPYRPFCCERCRLIDLGHWIKGDYRLPDDSKPLSEEEEADTTAKPSGTA